MRLVRKSTLAPIALLLIFACESSGDGCNGCDGAATVAYPVPPPDGGAVQSDVVRARITPVALDFFRTHLDLLLGAFLTIGEDGRAAYTIDPSLLPEDSPVSVRNGSTVSFDIDQLRDHMRLDFLDEDDSGRPGLRFSLEDFDLYMDVYLVTLISDEGTGIDLTGACHVRDSGELAALHLKRLAFDIRLGVTAGDTPQITGELQTPVIDLGDAGSSSINLDVKTCHPNFDGTCKPLDDNGVQQNGDPLCACTGTCTTDCSSTNNDTGYCSCQNVCGLLGQVGQLGDFLLQLLSPLFDDVLGPAIAGAVSDAVVGALGSLPLKFETQLSLASLVGAAFKDASPLAIKVQASSDLGVTGIDAAADPMPPPRADAGLDVALSGGVTPTVIAPCAVGVVAPDLSALVGPGPAYSGFVEVVDATGNRMERYHLALSASQRLIAQAAWAAYASGALCLEVDAYDVQSLVGSTFSFTAGLLQTFDQRLAGLATSTSPMLATLRPTEAPTLRLGAGHLVSTDVEESLIEVTFNDVEIGLYMLVDEAPSRVTGLTADLIVKLGLERTPQETLQVVVDGIEITDIAEEYNELAPGADVAGLVELIADLALDTFLGDNLKFGFDISSTVSEAIGVPLYVTINTVRKDLGTTGVPHLSVYATLCDDEDRQNAENTACYADPSATGRSLALHVGLGDPETSYIAPDPIKYDTSRWLGAPSGVVELRTDAASPAEYQTRVDGGPWSAFVTPVDGKLAVHSARLKVVGQHHIEVRGRVVGMPASTRAAGEVTLWIDRERPSLDAALVDAVVVASADDLGSGELTEIWSRVGDSAWQRVSDGRVNVAGVTGDVELMARDLAGNTSATRRFHFDAPAVRRPAPTALADGCSAATASPWVGLFLLALARRRRAS